MTAAGRGVEAAGAPVAGPGAGGPGGPEDLLARLIAGLRRPARPSSDHDLTPGTAGGSAPLRPAAVLVALQPGPAGWEVVLTRRSARLVHHPGQIALPGGKLDTSDAGPVTAALREAQEEVGLDPASVTPLGLLPAHETVTGFAITPVLAVAQRRLRPAPCASEVAEVFNVPLAHVGDLARYRLERRRWRGSWRNYYAVPWGPYYIWGATARILHGLAERMAP
jgi:8-oxo-dGTP pyrophosphatase MutT (NUDIX family)